MDISFGGEFQALSLCVVQIPSPLTLIAPGNHKGRGEGGGGRREGEEEGEELQNKSHFQFVDLDKYDQ